jgi:hypothetical protein
MATNIAFSVTQDPSAKWTVGTISGSAAGVILDTAGNVTASFFAEGYQNHDYQFELASVGTNVVVAIEVQTSVDGQWVERTVSSALTANGTYALTFSGFALNTRLKLKSISAGTPAIRNITATAANRYR